MSRRTLYIPVLQDESLQVIVWSTAGFFNLRRGWLSLIRGPPVNVQIRTTAHLFSAMPANPLLQRYTGSSDTKHFVSCSWEQFRNRTMIWVTTWQNQQNVYAPSEDSYQPRHPRSLIRVEASAWPSGYRSRLRITGSRVGIPLEARFFPNLNGASLHRAFHVHPSIVSKWLKYCWKDVNPNSSIHDQSLRCTFNGQLRTQGFSMWTAKTLIRLGGCPGWSESSLGAHSFCCFVMSRLSNTVRYSLHFLTLLSVANAYVSSRYKLWQSWEIGIFYYFDTDFGMSLHFPTE